MKVFKNSVLLFFTLLVFTVHSQINPSHKVVFQLTSADVMEQKGLLNNLNNVLEYWGSDVIIHVVIHGPGIEFVQKEKTKYEVELIKLIDRGVVVQVCENTLHQKNIDKKTLIPKLQYVPSGLVEIIKKQEEGWAYIKSNF